MYKEVLDILMEGIDDPIKEQLLKNQLEYHFKNKTEENIEAIDNTTVILRRVLNDLDIFDLINVEPLRSKKYTCTSKLGLWLNIIPKFQPELNEGVAHELDRVITTKIIDDMLQHASEHESLFVNKQTSTDIEEVVDSLMIAVDEVDGEWVIVDIATLELLQRSYTFTPNEGAKRTGSLTLEGYIDDKIKVFYTPIINDTILIGSTPDEKPPITYMPWAMVVLAETPDHKRNLRYPLLINDWTVVTLNDCANRYRKIDMVFADNDKKSNLMVDL